MSAQSIVSISNIALLSIGAQAQISSLNEGSTQSNACSQLFQFVYEMLSRTALWNCLRQQSTLSLIAAAVGTPENPQGTTLPLPPPPWLYSYQLPSACLRARYVVPTIPSTGSTPISPALLYATTMIPNQGQIPFRVAYSTDSSGNPLQIVLTNLSQAQLVYTVNQPNPQIWDAAFTAAMVASLAAWLVPALSSNMPLMGMQQKIAERLIAEARISDGDEGTTSQDHIPDFIRARNGGAYCATGWYGEGFGNMMWPAG